MLVFAIFQSDWTPPEHMPIVEGLVRSIRLPSEQADTSFSNANVCLICSEEILVCEQIKCFHCFNRYHCVCLANAFLGGNDGDFLVPVEGTCPACSAKVSWGDLMRFKKGCYRDGVEAAPSQL